MRKDAFNYEQKLEALGKDIKTWKEKLKMEIEEKEFYHWQALDAKRKNKLLKVALARMNVDRDKKENLPMIENKQPLEKDTDTFITGTNIDDPLKEVNADSIE